MATGTMRGLCKPQGALVLDKPYPYAQPNDQLPFCSQYSECTCCNASHALTIKTVLSGAYLDMSISQECREVLKTHSCSVCDPWVGTGGKKQYSRRFCDTWLEACNRTFVSQSPQTGELVWCSEDSPALICSRLSEVAANGTELCSLAGGSTHPGGVGMCQHTAKFQSQRPHGSMPHKEAGFAITSELLQEFLIWVVAFSALLGILVLMITRQRKKARKKALADSVFSGREGDSKFDSDIIREYKERYYAREKGLQAALGRARNAEDDGEY